MQRNPTHVPADILKLYETIEWNHASAIFNQDFPKEWKDLLTVLRGFRLRQSYVDADGANKSPISKAIDQAFADFGWGPKQFDTQVKVDDAVYDTPTHEVDNYKNGIAIETEWNNKDPFYDRDLNNFRLLHQLGVISVGVIITRADELNKAFKSIGKSFGPSTTQMAKLIPRVEGGGAGGCPILVFGIGMNLFVGDMTDQQMEERKILREDRIQQRKQRKRILLAKKK